MKVYISGPITGTNDFEEEFNRAEYFLKNMYQDCTVINPVRVCAELPRDTTHDQYMDVCIAMLKMCDTIYMIDGWRESLGANREYGFALGHGIQIIDLAVDMRVCK